MECAFCGHLKPKYRLVVGSEDNVEVRYLSPVNGTPNYKQLDITKPWSFKYIIECYNELGQKLKQSEQILISGSELTDCTSITSCVNTSFTVEDGDDYKITFVSPVGQTTEFEINKFSDADKQSLEDVSNASHTHANKALLDSITDAGSVNNYLAEDGRYIELYSSVSNLQSTNIKSSRVWITDSGKEGLFVYDPADTTSPDNGSTILVDASLKRYKKVQLSPQYADLVIQPEKSGVFQAVIGGKELVDTTGGAATVIIPSGAVQGDRIAIHDSRANAATDSITVDFNTFGYRLHGVPTPGPQLIQIDRDYRIYTYINATIGWIEEK